MSAEAEPLDGDDVDIALVLARVAADDGGGSLHDVIKGLGPLRAWSPYADGWAWLPHEGRPVEVSPTDDLVTIDYHLLCF